MGPTRILIVEDEPLIAMDLEDVVAEVVVQADVIVCSSVAEANSILQERVDFAFLDINVRHGVTFPLAEKLIVDRVPFAFISAIAAADLPSPLRSVPFLGKPASPLEVKHVLEAAQLPVWPDRPR